jgi:2Fe-2S ferredoxin
MLGNSEVDNRPGPVHKHTSTYGYEISCAPLTQNRKGFRDMPLVRVEPLGAEFEAQVGETIMSAALRSGYSWPTLCNGNGECSVCWTDVATGSENLTAVGEREGATLTQLPRPLQERRTVRLACQAQVLGAVTVQKKGVKRSLGADLCAPRS